MKEIQNSNNQELEKINEKLKQIEEKIKLVLSSQKEADFKLNKAYKQSLKFHSETLIDKGKRNLRKSLLASILILFTSGSFVSFLNYKSSSKLESKAEELRNSIYIFGKGQVEKKNIEHLKIIIKEYCKLEDIEVNKLKDEEIGKIYLEYIFWNFEFRKRQYNYDEIYLAFLELGKSLEYNDVYYNFSELDNYLVNYLRREMKHNMTDEEILNHPTTQFIIERLRISNEDYMNVISQIKTPILLESYKNEIFKKEK